MTNNKQYQVVEKFKYTILVSAVVALIAIVIMVINAFGGKDVMKFGLDFKGGAIISVELNDFNGNNQTFQDTFEEFLKKEITGRKFQVADRMQASPTDNGVIYELRLEYTYDNQPVKDQNDFMLKLNGVMEDDTVNGLKGELDVLLSGYNFGEGFSFEDSESKVSVSPLGATASSTLIKSAIFATIVAILVILVYIIFRFTFLSGLAAIIALAHDVLMVVALTTIFGVTVNSTFIAAVITVIGYSINATIVIFDKIRECKKSTAFANSTDSEVANYAIVNSFTKIILSTITTLIMVTALICFTASVSTIVEFILPIVFGLIMGTYSSLVLSPAVWVLLNKNSKKNVKNQVKG